MCKSGKNSCPFVICKFQTAYLFHEFANQLEIQSAKSCSVILKCDIIKWAIFVRIHIMKYYF